MRYLAVDYVRMALCGLTALLAVACARLAPANSYLAPRDPHPGAPPLDHSSPAAKQARAEAGAARLEKLHRDVAAIDSDLAYLRMAIATMGPLPSSGNLSVPPDAGATNTPVEGAAARSTITMDEFGAGIPAGDILASPPQLAAPRSLFFEAELATYPSQPEAEAAWQGLGPKIRLAGLEPRYDRANSSVRLSVGPLTSVAAVDALCAELSALAVSCHVAAPAGAYR